MVVVKLSKKVEGLGDKIYAPLCGVLCKEEDRYIGIWSGTSPYDKMHLFTLSKEENY